MFEKLQNILNKLSNGVYIVCIIAIIFPWIFGTLGFIVGGPAEIYIAVFLSTAAALAVGGICHYNDSDNDVFKPIDKNG